MNRLSFLTRVLLYAISNPKKGKQLLETKYQTMQHSEYASSQYEDKQLDMEEMLTKLFPNVRISVSEMQKNAKQIQTHIKEFFERIDPESYPSKKMPYPINYSLDNKSGLILYALCKIIKPESVVETGVAYGLSSMYILQALHENGKGTLHSIDSVFSPWQTKDMIGATIPSHLRKNWNFIFGTSNDKLKITLESLKSVDIFFHDSLHTYKNMMFEFNTAWPFIRSNGFLISDDIADNAAFSEFCTIIQSEPYVMKQKENSFLGIVRKV